MTVVTAPQVIWTPTPGSQWDYVRCPIFEALYDGTRGPGKSDGLLMDFAQHVGQGWGEAWRGVAFRQEYKPLAELVAKSKKWFRRIFPGARFLESKADYKWVWPTGEELIFRAFKSIADYWDFHGHEYPWVGWDELTAWPSLDCYHVMKSCCRSSVPNMPRKYRATTNPYGPGHNAVKAYFIDPAPAGVPFYPPRIELPAEFEEQLAKLEPLQAVRIAGHYSENTHLMAAQPNYPAVIAASAPSAAAARAWLADDWDIVAGGMFDDVWSRKIHVLEAWAPKDTPSSWRIFRAYDWGASKPFSVGWWTESDGTTAPNGLHYPRGTLIRTAEWYGWNGSPNVGLGLVDTEIAQGIVDREKDMGIAARVTPGPGDFPDPAPGEDSMRNRFASRGAIFFKPIKKPGSRENGWAKMRDLLRAALKQPMEEPGLFTLDSCVQFIRTIPTLPRDPKKIDDIDTKAEDHIADESRYAATSPKGEAASQSWRV